MSGKIGKLWAIDLDDYAATGNSAKEVLMKEQRDRKLAFLDGGVTQVAIIVEDLDAAVKAYWELFGIGPWHIYTYGKPLVKEMSYHGEPADYKMRIALSYLGPTRIELIQPLEGDTVYRDFVEEHGYGVHHFGVLVDDMDAALAAAEAAGLSMTMDGAEVDRFTVPARCRRLPSPLLQRPALPRQRVQIRLRNRNRSSAE